MEYIPVILCGGSGSRLFPLSRSNLPKQFIKVTNNLSLLQNTIVRFANLPEIILVTSKDHENIICNQLKELIVINKLSFDVKVTIFLEPATLLNSEI